MRWELPNRREQVSQSERVKFVKELLELPDSIEPLNIIPIGQPKSPLQPKDKYDAERIHYNGY